jgi:hypothetical protein
MPNILKDYMFYISVCFLGCITLVYHLEHSIFKLFVMTMLFLTVNLLYRLGNVFNNYIEFKHKDDLNKRLSDLLTSRMRKYEQEYCSTKDESQTSQNPLEQSNA